MANADAAFGFRPVNAEGGPYNGGTLRAVIASGATAAAWVGDPVKLAGGAAINGYPRVRQAAAGDPVLGVIVSFDADPTALENQYRLVSTERFIKMASVSGDKYFEIQSDDAGTALVEDDVGHNANFVVALGSTTTGFSGVELNSDSVGTTSSLDLQIVSLVDRADNILVNTGSTNKNAIVKFNDPQDKPVRLGVA